jgi:hypothetical protein
MQSGDSKACVDTFVTTERMWLDTTELLHLDRYYQGIAGLDYWIAQSGLQSSLVDWIVIDNPNSKLDFGFGLSIQFFHFNPNPKKFKNFFIKLKYNEA